MLEHQVIVQAVSSEQVEPVAVYSKIMTAQITHFWNSNVTGTCPGWDPMAALTDFKDCRCRCRGRAQEAVHCKTRTA